MSINEEKNNNLKNQYYDFMLYMYIVNHVISKFI